MPSRSVFTKEEQRSIRLERFIFHLIITKKNEPEYLSKVTLTPTQVEFFKKLFVDASRGIMYRFLDKERSKFYKDCEGILNGDEQQFISTSESIVADFHRLHNRSASDGLFIVSTVNVIKGGEAKKLIFLVKMDNRAVYQYSLKKKEASLREILNTIVEDKASIQKFAIVDLESTFKWDVLANERHKVDSESVAEYFKSFLTVTELEVDSKMTKRIVSAVRTWAVLNRSKIPTNLTESDFRDMAVDYMKGNPVYEEEQCIDFVVSLVEDKGARKLYKESLTEYFYEQDLGNLSFNTKPGSLKKKGFRKVYETFEGLKIEFEGTEASVNLEISEKKDAQGMYQVLIQSTSIDRKE